MFMTGVHACVHVHVHVHVRVPCGSTCTWRSMRTKQAMLPIIAVAPAGGV
jgi:hypothetical protein